ncbi:MAG: hypothetical protein IJW21_01285, partial [Clostridia bacterium]|nr:hypothetical protein [Clostridia bacterium]
MKNILKIFMFALCFACALSLSSCEYPPEDGAQTHEHNVLHWEIVYDVDCESDGRRVGTCIDCMNEVRDEQQSLTHDYRGGTCVRCGKTEGGAGEQSKPMFEYKPAAD